LPPNIDLSEAIKEKIRNPKEIDLPSDDLEILNQLVRDASEDVELPRYDVRKEIDSMSGFKKVLEDSREKYGQMPQKIDKFISGSTITSLIMALVSIVHTYANERDSNLALALLVLGLSSVLLSMFLEVYQSFKIKRTNKVLLNIQMNMDEFDAGYQKANDGFETLNGDLNSLKLKLYLIVSSLGSAKSLKSQLERDMFRVNDLKSDNDIITFGQSIGISFGVMSVGAINLTLSYIRPESDD
jgi:hypothetical protein